MQERHLSGYAREGIMQERHLSGYAGRRIPCYIHPWYPGGHTTPRVYTPLYIPGYTPEPSLVCRAAAAGRWVLAYRASSECYRTVR